MRQKRLVSLLSRQKGSLVFLWRVVMFMNTEMEAGSALGFSNDEELVTDEGTAKGSLADALIMAMKQMVARSN